MFFYLIKIKFKLRHNKSESTVIEMLILLHHIYFVSQSFAWVNKKAVRIA